MKKIFMILFVFLILINISMAFKSENGWRAITNTMSFQSSSLNESSGSLNIINSKISNDEILARFWQRNLTFAVVVVVDSTPPVFTNLINHTQEANISFSYDVDATDDSALDTWWLNDTTVFNITQVGLITNITGLTSIEIYWLNISLNDTWGNLVSDVFFINITEVEGVEVITFLGYVNIRPQTIKVPYVRLNRSIDFTTV